MPPHRMHQYVLSTVESDSEVDIFVFGFIICLKTVLVLCEVMLIDFVISVTYLRLMLQMSKGVSKI